MIQGLYAAASGMLAVEKRQDVLANNLSNASTPGFKRHEPVQLGFYGVFSDRLRQGSHFTRQSGPGGGVKVVETFADPAPGLLQETNNPLQMAIDGPGFFVIDTPNGERYTRNGNFTIDADGDLATEAGYKVLGDGGPLRVGGGVFTLSDEGAARVDGLPVGRMQLVEFTQPERLMRQGDSYFEASEDVLNQSQPATLSRVAQKHIESSNVHVAKEVSSMTLALRHYEANQRVVTAIDATLSKLIDQVGMPQS